MRYFTYLFLHELRMLWIAPATYIASIMFLVLMAFIYVFYLYFATTAARETLPTEWFFQSFFWPVFFMVPLLTMRSFAEDRRLGTLETLMSTPVTAGQIVCSKYLAIYVFYIGLWSLTLLFPCIVYLIQPELVLDAGLFKASTLFGGFVFVGLSGAFYISIGIFASSITRSQLIAGVICFSILFVVIVSGQLLMRLPIDELEGTGGIIDYFRTFKHLEDFSRGLVDTRPLILYLSGAWLFVGTTTLVIESNA